MATRIVHIEIRADDTAKAKEFWGSLFGWQFEAYPGPSEYHMARIDENSGAAIMSADD
jgi:predicted enzyme related to lactoylglutathione lyase